MKCLFEPVFKTVLIVAVFVFPALVAKAQDFPMPPEPWKTYIELDRGQNIRYRRTQIVTSTPFKIFHFEAMMGQSYRLKQLTIVTSNFPVAATEKNFFFLKDGQPGFRIFWPHRVSEPFFSRLVALFGQPRQEYWAVRLQGHASYFIWNPDKPQAKPFIAKFEMRRVFNSSDSLTLPVRSVFINDAVEKILRSNERKISWPSENRDVVTNGIVNFFPEPVGALVETLGDRYQMTIRSLEPRRPTTGVVLRRPFVRLYPLHGILSNTKVLSKFAAQKDLTIEAWIESEYLVKLAKFAAELIYKFGIYPSAHTQNLAVYIDEQSGEILSFMYKDMQDCMFDPYTIRQERIVPSRVIANAELDHIYDRYAFGNSTIDKIEDPETPGAFVSHFLGQSIMLFTEKKELYAKYAVIFLNEYCREIARLTGIHVSIGQHRIKDFLGFEQQAKADPTISWEIVRRVLLMTIEDIYQAILRGRIAKVAGDLVSVSDKGRGLLTVILKDQIRKRTIAFFAKAAATRIVDPTNEMEFFTHPDGLYVRDKKTKQMLAFAFGLDNSQKQLLAGIELTASELESESESCEKQFVEKPIVAEGN